MTKTVSVEIIRCTNAAGRPVEIGEKLTLVNTEARLLIASGVAVECDGDTGGGGGVDEGDEADESEAPRRGRGRPRVS